MTISVEVNYEHVKMHFRNSTRPGKVLSEWTWKYMRNPFERFSDKEPIGLKVRVAEETSEMRSLFGVYEKFLELDPQTPADAVYRWSQEQTSSIDLTQKLIEDFTRRITGLDAMKGVYRTGYFISAMINRLFEGEKLEMTLQIKCRVRGLGYRFSRGDLKISGAPRYYPEEDMP